MNSFGNTGCCSVQVLLKYIHFNVYFYNRDILLLITFQHIIFHVNCESVTMKLTEAFT